MTPLAPAKAATDLRYRAALAGPPFSYLVSVQRAWHDSGMALDMRPGCERCDRDLPADQDGAYICSFECTFCAACNEADLKGTCPNCGGVLIPRPTRVGVALAKFPARTERVYKPVD